MACLCWEALFAAEVEVQEDGFGRARFGVSADGWSAYPAATLGGYRHRAMSLSASGKQAHGLLPEATQSFPSSYVGS